MSTSAMAELLGDTLIGKDGSVPTAEALAGKAAVALYFSAHWCPPCRGFTPQLAKQYTSHYKAKGLEIVFVSSDRSEAAFFGYFAEMPWLALPYAERAAKEALSKRYRVRGIPTLVVLDAEGNTITTQGREAVSKDPTGEKLPWYPPTREERGRAVLGALGGLAAEAGGKPIALYFSAHWCPPCKAFTPQLAAWYSEGLKDNLEVVFISGDQDQASFDGYFGEMPWKALPFEKREAKEVLSDACGVEGIPSLVVIDSETGLIITTDGRSKVARDPTGASIASGGWLPQPFNNVNEAPGDLSERRCVVALGDDEATAAAVREVAEEQFEAAGKDMDAMAHAFFFAPPGGVTAQLRKLTMIAAGSELVILDIPDDGSFYVCEGLGEGGASADDVRAFMQAVSNNSLTKRQLQRQSRRSRWRCCSSACRVS